MTSASETERQEFIQNFERIKPEDQVFIALLMEGVSLTPP